MEEIHDLTLKILELEKNIINKKLLEDKKNILSKLLLEIKILNTKVIAYETKIDYEICNMCNHVYEDFYQRYDKTRQKCIHCGDILY